MRDFLSDIFVSIVTLSLSKKKVPLVIINLTIRKIDRRGGEGNVGKNMMQTIRTSQNISELLPERKKGRKKKKKQAEVRNGATNFGSHVFRRSTKIGWKAFFSVYFTLTHSKVNKSNVSIRIKNNVIKFEISVD